jgi:hypothetical protein
VGDTIQFVDSIASSPTVRLDVNDDTTWACTNFDAPPPRLRRSVASNLLQPGGYVASSTHDFRVVTMTLEVVNTTQDLNATELQKLARELDRPTNFIRYQPNTLTKPVFFKTYRSDVSEILDMLAAKAYRQITVEVLADPYALGLVETAMNAVNLINDPATGTNKCWYALPTILGDVPAPCIITMPLANLDQRLPMIGMCSTTKTLSGPFFYQAESATNGTDTTSTADATASGGNRKTTTFVTPTYATRLTGTLTNSIIPYPGTYRVFLRAKKTVATDTFMIRMFQDVPHSYSGSEDVYYDEGPDATSTNWHWLDLGAQALPWGVPSGVDQSFESDATFDFLVGMTRTAGSGQLYTDVFLFVPVDGPFVDHATTCTVELGTSDFNATLRIDTEADCAFQYVAGTPNRIGGSNGFAISGGLPWVCPNRNNYLSFLPSATDQNVRLGDGSYAVQGAPTISTTIPITLTYYPRYLYVRPSAS